MLSAVYRLGFCLLAMAFVGCGSQSRPDSAAPTLEVIASLPRDGLTLGAPDAPFTLSVFAALDAPAAGFLAFDLPELEQRWMREGRLRLQLRTLSGEDALARELAETVHAAGLQNRLWEVLVRLWLSDDQLVDRGGVATAIDRVGGLDPRQLQADAESEVVAGAIASADDLAAELGLSDVPAFTLEGPDGTVELDGACDGCLARDMQEALDT